MSILLFLLCADASVPVFLGWSEDGGVVALLQYGVHDGSGFPFAYLQIIRPSGNDRFFYEYFCYEEETNDEWLIQMARESAKTAGVSGNKTGKALKIRILDSLLIVEPSCTRTIKKYSLGKGEFSIEEKNCTQLSDPYTWPHGTVRCFWKEREVFSSGLEGAGFSWWLEEAYLYRGRFAMVLGHLEPGFEGPDARFRLMVIEEK